MKPTCYAVSCLEQGGEVDSQIALVEIDEPTVVRVRRLRWIMEGFFFENGGYGQATWHCPLPLWVIRTIPPWMEKLDYLDDVLGCSMNAQLVRMPEDFDPDWVQQEELERVEGVGLCLGSHWCDLTYHHKHGSNRWDGRLGDQGGPDLLGFFKG